MSDKFQPQDDIKQPQHDENAEITISFPYLCDPTKIHEKTRLIMDKTLGRQNFKY